LKGILRLRGEIIISAILSVVIASIITMLMSNIENMFNKEKEYHYIEGTETKRINYIIDEYKQGDIDANELSDIVNKWDNKYLNIYLVNSAGEVLASRERGINNINLDEVNDKVVKKLDGKNAIEVYGVININDEKELVYYYNYYVNDSKTYIYILALTAILFTLFTRGRILYIEEINKGITSIANGELKKRINIKYKNELSTLAENVNIMTSHLEEEENKKREFITNISHDLRTPLTTMLGYIKMIEESKYQNEEELNKYVAMISRKGNYLKILLDDFFTYSKLSSNDIKVRYSTIDCQLFLQQINEEEKINFTRKNLDLKLQMIEEKTYVNVDSDLMARAIYNLLSNALKYSEEKTQVKVIMEEENHYGELYVCISIISTPKEKIGEEEFDKLFERLYKREEGRSSKGSGLGLAITKEIMKLNDGFIKAQVLKGDVEFKLGFRKDNKDS